MQKDTLWRMKSMLNSNLSQHISFTTFVPRKNVSIHGFWIFASSILIAFAILLENDDVFKLSIYLDMYFFFLCRHFAHQKGWSISVNPLNTSVALI